MLVLSAVIFAWSLAVVTAKLHDVLVSPDCVFSPARAEGLRGDTIAFSSATDHLVQPSAGKGRSSQVAQVPSLFEVPASGTTHPFFCRQPGSPGRSTFIFTVRDSDGRDTSLPLLWGVGVAVSALFVVALCGGCCMYQRRAGRRERRAAAATNLQEVEMELPKYQPRSQTGEVVLQPDIGRTPPYTAPEGVPVIIVRSESPAPITPETTTASAGRALPLRQRTK